ncbi:MAG: linear amide C-N hydrolase [Bacteroides thetaiotaomicron]|nr:linear amide C-N hydrolase [Bacteroides thetaiotaomicron]
MKKKLTGVALVLAAVSLMGIQPAEACTRAVYLGPDGMVVTGRTMDWKEDIMSNIYVFPRGMQRAGHNKEKTVNWTSKYGSVIATGYDIGTCDGMNEKGLVASLLFLPESVYSLPGDTRPAMGISIWTQYVLDNFATVREAVDEMKKETFRIDAPRMPNGGPESTLHMAITDETGNTAVIEYLDGKLSIHEGKEYQVMTNSPRYELQLAVNDYFSVPFGINTPEKPHISSTRWRSVSDQKNKVYYFESTLTPNLFWLDLKKIDFSPKAGVKKLSLTKGEIYAGDAVKDLKDSQSFTFLFETPVM